MEEDLKNLYKIAFEQRKFSYSPYSGFSVGAALLCEDGTVYTGCNIENSSFSMTNCAERTAVFKAISEGKRKFKAIAISGGRNIEADDVCYPCGACRQVLSEFCTPDLIIILKNKTCTLGSLLPFSFTLTK